MLLVLLLLLCNHCFGGPLQCSNRGKKSFSLHIRRITVQFHQIQQKILQCPSLLNFALFVIHSSFRFGKQLLLLILLFLLLLLLLHIIYLNLIKPGLTLQWEIANYERICHLTTFFFFSSWSTDFLTVDKDL